MVYFLLTCTRDCEEICEVASILADPVHIHLPMGLELAKFYPVSLSLQEQTRPPHSVKLGILGRLVPAGM